MICMVIFIANIQGAEVSRGAYEQLRSYVNVQKSRQRIITVARRRKWTLESHGAPGTQQFILFSNNNRKSYYLKRVDIGTASGCERWKFVILEQLKVENHYAFFV